MWCRRVIAGGNIVQMGLKRTITSGSVQQLESAEIRYVNQDFVPAQGATYFLKLGHLEVTTSTRPPHWCRDQDEVGSEVYLTEVVTAGEGSVQRWQDDEPPFIAMMCCSLLRCSVCCRLKRTGLLRRWWEEHASIKSQSTVNLGGLLKPSLHSITIPTRLIVFYGRNASQVVCSVVTCFEVLRRLWRFWQWCMWGRFSYGQGSVGVACRWPDTCMAYSFGIFLTAKPLAAEQQMPLVREALLHLAAANVKLRCVPFDGANAKKPQ